MISALRLRFSLHRSESRVSNPRFAGGSRILCDVTAYGDLVRDLSLPWLGGRYFEVHG